MENESLHQEFLEKIEEAFRIRDFNDAIEVCQEALKSNPDNEEIKKKLQRAIELQEAEPFLQSFISTGQTLLESGLCVDAIKQFEKVKVIDPTYPGVEDLIVQARAAIQGDFFSGPSSAPETGSAASYEPSAFTPTDAKVQSIIREGERLFMLGNYQQSIDAWSEVFMYDITNKQAHDLIEKARNELIMAKGQIQKLLEEARRLYEEKNYEDSMKIVRKALDLDENNEEARQLFTLVSTKAGTTPEVDLGQQAEQAYQGKEWKRAMELYQQLIQLQPDHPLASQRISECRSLLQKKDQAAKLVSDAQVFHMQGKKDSAIFALQKALEIDPGNKEADIFLSTIQASTMAAGPSAPATSVKGKKSMLIPGVVILLIAVLAAAYFLFFKKEDPPPLPPSQQKRTLPTPIPQQPNELPVKPPPQQPDTTPKVSPEKLLVILDEAHNFYEQKNLPEALKKYQEVIALSPNNPDALARVKEIESTLAAIAVKKGKFLLEAQRCYSVQRPEYSDFEGMVKIFKAAAQEFPNDHDPDFVSMLKDGYYNLGISSLQKKQCAAADDYFKQIQFIDPYDASAFAEIEIAGSCSGKTSIEPSILYKIDALKLRPFIMPPLPQPPAKTTP